MAMLEDALDCFFSERVAMKITALLEMIIYSQCLRNDAFADCSYSSSHDQNQVGCPSSIRCDSPAIGLAPTKQLSLQVVQHSRTSRTSLGLSRPLRPRPTQAGLPAVERRDPDIECAPPKALRRARGEIGMDVAAPVWQSQIENGC